MNRANVVHADPNKEFQPIRLIEVDLKNQIVDITLKNEKTHQYYRKFRVLVKLNDHLLGLEDFEVNENILGSDGLVQRIWDDFNQPINQYLVQNGLEPVNCLPVEGLSSQFPFPSRREQQILLTDVPAISIILCTRDRTDQLNSTLPKLVALDYPKYEILIVDNAPQTNATFDLLKQYTKVNSSLHYFRENRPGLSWARNCGLKHAQGEIVAFLDDDETADGNWLWELAKGFQVSSDVACVTGMILPAELETQSQLWFEDYGGHTSRVFHQRIYNAKTLGNQSPLFPNPPFGAGGNMTFKTTLLREIGGFDCALGTGTLARAGEDTASFYDVLTHGYTLVYNPAAFVYHTHYKDYNGLRKQFHGYGVGLTAFYTRCLLKHPKNLFEILKLLPKGLSLLLRGLFSRSGQPENVVPKDLIHTKLRGMFLGPLAYLKSLYNLNKIMKMDYERTSNINAAEIKN